MAFGYLVTKLELNSNWKQKRFEVGKQYENIENSEITGISIEQRGGFYVSRTTDIEVKYTINKSNLNLKVDKINKFWFSGDFFAEFLNK